MAFTDDFAASLASIEPMLNQAITWNGLDYPCIATRKRKGANLEMGGWGIDAELIVIVRGSVFGGVLPARGQTITFAAIDYRINDITTAPGDAFLRLACVDASRGA